MTLPDPPDPPDLAVSTPPVPDAEDELGGDPACWLSRVCDRCGRLSDDLRAHHCEQCGTELSTH